MADELLDLVNKKDEVIGEVWKSAAHKDPTLIHREVSVLLFNKEGETLLQQRGMKKLINPGQWQIAACGHIGKGEEPLEAAKRETEEEMSIKVEPIFAYKYFKTSKDRESRFFYVYYAFIPKDTKIVMNDNEVMAAKWLKLSDIGEFIAKNNFGTDSYKELVYLIDKLKLS